MSKFSAFLAPDVEGIEKELVISDRFLDEKGKVIPFKIRAVTQEENERLTKQATRRKKEGNQYVEELDAIEYSRRLLVQATVYPPFSDAEFCAEAGVADPLLLPGKILLSGEYAALMKAITDLSGFGKEHDEVKN